MLDTLKKIILFILPFLVAIIIVTILLMTFSKGDLQLAVNRMNNPFFDSFFKYATWFGDGTMVILIGLIFLFIEFRKFFIIITSFLLSGLIVQVLKRLIFVDAVRPVKFFKDTVDLHLVNGIKMYNDHSFPSGHSASAFAFFLCIALFTKSRIIQFLSFIAAGLIAYSRVYLSQHFVIDAYAGSIIGVFVALLCNYWFYLLRNDWLGRNVQYYVKR